MTSNITAKEKITALAIDLGASGGRGIAGSFDGKRIQIDIVRRFENCPVYASGTLYWDVLRLFHEIKCSIRDGFKAGYDIKSIGVDTWGVDFGLLDKDGCLMENPVHYRDKRVDGMMDRVFELIPADELYGMTGIQFMEFNTIFQLYSLAIKRPELLGRADKLLFIPDLINFFLTGKTATEHTILSTSQLMDPNDGHIIRSVLERLGIPTKIFSDIIKPCNKLGAILPQLQAELNVPAIETVNVASHDTASAVVAVPSASGDFAFISCGTWSLLGTELGSPFINRAAREHNFTNEAGIGDSIRFLKNISGLYILQECRRQWTEEGDILDWEQINELARNAESTGSYIDPSDEMFLSPGKMADRIADYLLNTEQKACISKGELVLCITESLALEYAHCYDNMESILGKEFNAVHIVGGGAQNRLLCQYTANTLGKTVLAGPYEATAIGNIAVQLMSMGLISDIKQAREIIARSFPPEVYEPMDMERWAVARERYRRIKEVNV